MKTYSFQQMEITTLLYSMLVLLGESPGYRPRVRMREISHSETTTFLKLSVKYPGVVKLFDNKLLQIDALTFHILNS